MKKNKNFSLRALFSNKKFTAVFSLIVAFVCWLAITINQTETRTMTFANVAINIDIEDSFAGKSGLQVVSEDYVKSASVTVEGPNSVVSSLKPGDIWLNADLSNVTKPGEYEIELKEKSEESGFTFVDISPKKIKLTFDYIDTKDFEIIAKADGITAVNGLIKDTPMLNHAGDSTTMTIKGPRAYISAIERVEIIVDEKEQINSSKTFDARLVITDKDGNTMDNKLFELPVDELKVTVPIYKEKELTVIPTFNNEPYKGAGIARVSKLSNTRIKVHAAPEIIDALEHVDLATIDYNDIVPGKTVEVSISLPAGVKNVSGVSKVKVTFKK